MPSPTWRTVPTSARSVSTSYSSIRCFRIEVISSGRSFTQSPLLVLSCGCQLPPEALEPAADARVETARADLEHDPADQARIDLACHLDLTAGGLLDVLQELPCLLVGELDCRR